MIYMFLSIILKRIEVNKTFQKYNYAGKNTLGIKNLLL